MEKDKDKIININVEDILPNRFQPRLAFDEKELNELSNSILKYGVIQPIILRKIGKKYEIIAGERRYKASVLAGLKTVPAIINNTDDNTSAEIALLENLQRKDLTVIEEAQSFKKLIDRGFTQEEIANKMGISQSSIANKIRLLNLPKKVQDALLFNKISERHARSLLSLNDKEKQEKLLNRIINEKLTVRQTEEEVSKLLNNYKVEDDIPDVIRQYINRNDSIQQIPDDDIKLGDGINPYQTDFESSIRKIEKEVENKEESYYDKIISEDFKNNRFDFVQSTKELDKITDNDIKTFLHQFDDKNKESVQKIVSKVRNYVKGLKAENVETKELDMPDKYQIIIEIKKDN